MIVYLQISDTDNDGLLNDKELNEFQVSWHHSFNVIRFALRYWEYM